MSTGFKKVGHKSRRGRKRSPKGHRDHRKAGGAAGSDRRRAKAERRRKLQELRTPEIDW